MPICTAITPKLVGFQHRKYSVRVEQLMNQDRVRNFGLISLGFGALAILLYGIFDLLGNVS
jgi:hypothetical protein